MVPDKVLATDDDALRACGLSAAKIRYAKILATEIAEGRVRLDDLDGMDDDAALAHLTAVKGIGAWTAEVYLLFAHGRPDLWPADDIAVIPEHDSADDPVLSRFIDAAFHQGRGQRQGGRQAKREQGSRHPGGVLWQVGPGAWYVAA